MKAANDGNILSITDDNVRMLSPYYHDFTFLKDYNIEVYIYAGEFESDRFREQSKRFAYGPMTKFLTKFGILSVDHFDMVELLAETNYEVTTMIMNSLVD